MAFSFRIPWLVMAASLALGLSCVPSGAAQKEHMGMDNQKLSAEIPPRSVLENFTRVGFYNGQKSPEDMMLPGVMRAINQYMNNDCGLPGLQDSDDSVWRSDAYGLFHGVSGQGFHFYVYGWCTHDQWGDHDYRGADVMDAYKYCLDVSGLSYEMLLRPDFAKGLNYKGAISDDEAEYRRRILENVSKRKMPVIGIRMFGKPEPGVITGYDENGDVLIGWDHFQPEKRTDDSSEPSGCYRKLNWFQDIAGIVLITGKKKPASTDEIYRKGLKRGLRDLYFSGTPERPLGIAAYDVCVKSLLDDAAYAAADDKWIKEQLTSLRVGFEIAERRCFVQCFLLQAAKHYPAAKKDLLSASNCFQLIHDLTWRMEFNAEPQPEKRREMAAMVLLARDLDLRAARHIERALKTMGEDLSDLPKPPKLMDRTKVEGVRVIPFYSSDLSVPFATSLPNIYHNMDLYLNNFPKYRTWNKQVCSFAGSLSAALATTKHPYSYEDLMGYSGLAFRTRWFHNPEKRETIWGNGRWHPVSPHGEQQEQLDALAGTTGWKLRLEIFRKDDKLRKEQLATDAIISINFGKPALVSYNTDMGVAIGCNVWNQQLLLNHQHAQDQEFLRAGYQDAGLHSPFIFLDDHLEPLAPREAFVKALRLALANDKRAKEDGFLFGTKALKAWRDDLLAYDSYAPEERELLFMTNWWTLLHLADARKSAVAFLKSHRDLLDSESQKSLDEALECYRQEADLLDSFLNQNRQYVLWWGGMKGVADWNSDAIERQIGLLTKSAALEKRVLSMLEESCAIP